VPTLPIEVFTKNVVFKHVHVPGPFGPGELVVFSDDLLNVQNADVGTHSGFATLVRITAGEPNLVQYQATYDLKDVPGTPQRQGQVTTRGLVPFIGAEFLGSPKVAITGGTWAYLTPPLVVR
jgi:hypothetical protein